MTKAVLASLLAVAMPLCGCAAHKVETPAAAPKSAPAKSSPPPPAAKPGAVPKSGSVEPGSPGAPVASVPSPAPQAKAQAPAGPAPSATESSYVFAPQQAAVGSQPAGAAAPSGTAKPHAAPAPGAADASKETEQENPADTAPRELQLAVVASAPDVAVGGIVTVDVMASSSRAVVDAPLHLTFDPSVMEFVDGTVGDFLAQGGSSVVFFADGRTRPGDVAVAAGRVERAQGARGAGLLCRVRFRGTSAGNTPIVVGRAKAWGVQNEELTVVSAGTNVVVR